MAAGVLRWAAGAASPTGFGFVATFADPSVAFAFSETLAGLARAATGADFGGVGEVGGVLEADAREGVRLRERAVIRRFDPILLDAARSTMERKINPTLSDVEALATDQ